MNLPYVLRSRLGICGGVLLVAAAIGHGLLVAPRVAQREALLARLAETPVHSAADSRQVEQQLSAFQRLLPTTASVPQWLGRIRNAAVQSGLALRSADYKLDRVADSSVMRYRITLPLSGSYAQIRSFVGTVLSEVPAASIDDVQLKRDADSPRKLDARIRLTLFIGAS